MRETLAQKKSKEAGKRFQWQQRSKEKESRPKPFRHDWTMYSDLLQQRQLR